MNSLLSKKQYLPIKICCISISMVIQFGIILVSPCQAQQYSVTITIAVSPPYPPKINEYTAQPDKIMATLLNTSTQVKQVFVQGTITGEGGIKVNTDPNYKMPQPLTLQPGIPFLMNQGNIQQVFSSDHLVFQGITKDELLYGTGLPEGDYTICLQAFDYNTNQQVSHPGPQGCSNTFGVTSIEVPVILQPVCGDAINPVIPQNVIFSWTRPPGAPVNTQFNLKIIEVLPTDRNINDAMKSAAHPVFFDKTVGMTSCILGPSDPQLMTGKKYAFAVTAIDPSGQATFRNKGMSEVCNFFLKETGTFPPDSVPGNIYTIITVGIIVHVEAGGSVVDGMQEIEIMLPGGGTMKVLVKLHATKNDITGEIKYESLVQCQWIKIKKFKEDESETIIIEEYEVINELKDIALEGKNNALDLLNEILPEDEKLKTKITEITDILYQLLGRNDIGYEPIQGCEPLCLSYEKEAQKSLYNLINGQRNFNRAPEEFRNAIKAAKKDIDDAVNLERDAAKSKSATLKDVKELGIPFIDIKKKISEAKKIEEDEKATPEDLEKDMKLKLESITLLSGLLDRVTNDISNINLAIDNEKEAKGKKENAIERINVACLLITTNKNDPKTKGIHTAWGELLGCGDNKNGAKQRIDQSLVELNKCLTLKDSCKDALTKLKDIIQSVRDNIEMAKRSEEQQNKEKGK